MFRPLAETIPAVTVACNPNGLPTASTQSPTCMLSEFPSFAMGNEWSTSILITARSVSWSEPITLASCCTPGGSSCNRTRIRSAFSTTCRLVTMNPLASTITPDPSERSRTGPASPPCPPKNLSKKSPKGLFSSSPPGFCPRLRTVGLTVDSVLILTTAGSIAFEICANWFESCRGSGILNGVASAVFLSCPLTPPETIVPIRMPKASVNRMTRVDARRFALNRSHNSLARTCMLTCLRNPNSWIITVARSWKTAARVVSPS